jgi:hypothetical protein
MTCTSVLSAITLVLHPGVILGFLGWIYVVLFSVVVVDKLNRHLRNYQREIDIEIVHTSCYLPGDIEYGAFA